MKSKPVRVRVPKETRFGVIVFYGTQIASSYAMADLFSRLKEWYESQQSPPVRMGLAWPDKDVPVMKYSRAEKHLIERGFDDLTEFEVDSIEPGGADQLTAPRLVCFYSRDGAYLVLGGNLRLVDLNRNSLLESARFIASILRPEYGIGYRREFQYGPGYYAIGLCQGPMPTSIEQDEEYTRISKWGYEAMPNHRYREGLLRDVYPWNFLSAFQLDAQVGDKTLKAWISANPERGRLETLTDHMLLWSLNDEQIPPVRQALWDAGRIYDYRKFEPATRVSRQEAEASVLDMMGYREEAMRRRARIMKRLKKEKEMRNKEQK